MAAPYSISLKPPGDCFAKCRDVPWFMMSRGAQTYQNLGEQYSCKNAKAIGCTVPGGQQLGFIDYKRRHPQRWWTCHCDSGKYYYEGSCKGGWLAVEQESDNW